MRSRKIIGSSTYTFTIYTIIYKYLPALDCFSWGDDNKWYSKKIMSVLGELFVIYSWLSSAVSSGCASNFFCLAYIMSRESFLHFALIDYDVKFQLPRHRMTLSQSWTKGSDLKNFFQKLFWHLSLHFIKTFWQPHESLFWQSIVKK